MVTVRRLQKWHGAGNDFLVDVCDPGEGEWWTRSRARAVCHRTTGVGADGLLVATLTSPVTMVLFNSDGSTAEMTGNGIRCLAAAVRRSTNATFSSLDVATFAGLRTVSLKMEGAAGHGSVSMGEVTFSDALEGTLGVVNVGNPHVVVSDEVTWSDAQREELAAKLAAQAGRRERRVRERARGGPTWNSSHRARGRVDAGLWDRVGARSRRWRVAPVTSATR
jgi:diaminopimelate epimerase